jgi:hypothetical protein
LVGELRVAAQASSLSMQPSLLSGRQFLVDDWSPTKPTTRGSQYYRNIATASVFVLLHRRVPPSLFCAGARWKRKLFVLRVQMKILEWINVSGGEKTNTASGLNSVLPVLEWLRGYQIAWLRPDIIAGLTAAAVVIPKAMAYASIAGLPVQVGLYTVFLPMIIYALLGTSRALSVSTTTTLAILVAAQLVSNCKTKSIVP